MSFAPGPASGACWPRLWPFSKRMSLTCCSVARHRSKAGSPWSRPARSWSGDAEAAPLLITDCDEVLLHMVSHFDAWLGEAHGIRFAFETGNFGEAMTDQSTGEAGRRGPGLAAARPILPPGNASPDAGSGRGRGAWADWRGRRHRHPHQSRRRGPSLAGRPAGQPRHPARSRLQPRRQGRSGAGDHRSLWRGRDRVRRRSCRSTMPRSPSMRPRSIGCTWSPSRGLPRPFRPPSMPMPGSTTGRPHATGYWKGCRANDQDHLHHRRHRRDRRGHRAQVRRPGLAGGRHRPPPRPARRAGGRAGRLLPSDDARHALPGRFRARADGAAGTLSRHRPAAQQCRAGAADEQSCRTRSRARSMWRSTPMSPAWSR